MKTIIIGGGGHAKVLIDLLYNTEANLPGGGIGILDDALSLGSEIRGCPVVGKLVDCERYKEKVRFVIGFGDNRLRRQVTEQYQLSYLTLIHPSAVIGSEVKIGEGTVVMAGAVINTECSIGKHCIINTGATVDHECVIADYVHISPGVHLGGRVRVGICSWVGIGSCVKNDICIRENSTVGAGAVVVQDIWTGCTVVGNPAKPISDRIR